MHHSKLFHFYFIRIVIFIYFMMFSVLLMLILDQKYSRFVIFDLKMIHFLEMFMFKEYKRVSLRLVILGLRSWFLKSVTPLVGGVLLPSFHIFPLSPLNVLSFVSPNCGLNLSTTLTRPYIDPLFVYYYGFNISL